MYLEKSNLVLTFLSQQAQSFLEDIATSAQIANLLTGKRHPSGCAVVKGDGGWESVSVGRDCLAACCLHVSPQVFRCWMNAHSRNSGKFSFLPLLHQLVLSKTTLLSKVPSFPDACSWSDTQSYLTDVTKPGISGGNQPWMNSLATKILFSCQYPQ